jgi:hypothetical protein
MRTRRLPVQLHSPPHLTPPRHANASGCQLPCRPEAHAMEFDHEYPTRTPSTKAAGRPNERRVHQRVRCPHQFATASTREATRWRRADTATDNRVRPMPALIPDRTALAPTGGGMMGTVVPVLRSSSRRMRSAKLSAAGAEGFWNLSTPQPSSRISTTGHAVASSGRQPSRPTTSATTTSRPCSPASPTPTTTWRN